MFKQVLSRRISTTTSSLIGLRSNSNPVVFPKTGSFAVFQRFNSSNSNPETAQIDFSEDVDEWLTAVNQLREEFSNPNKPYNPETSLAAPGEFKLHSSTVGSSASVAFSKEQRELFDNIKDSVIPKQEDPVIQYGINLIMRNGKKATAEKIFSRALYLVKLKSSNADPVQILKETLEKLSPLVEVKTIKDGTAKLKSVPFPLPPRRKLRFAYKWILDGSSKRLHKDFAIRLGEEILAAYNGNSAGYEKRALMHKEAIVARAYVNLR